MNRSCHRGILSDMKSKTMAAALAAGVVLAAASLGIARADTVVYVDPALPGPVINCAWFDDHLDDRTEYAIVRQVDLLFNRAALSAGDQATITQSGVTQRGEALVGFTLNRRSLCSDAAAFSSQPAPPSAPRTP